MINDLFKEQTFPAMLSGNRKEILKQFAPSYPSKINVHESQTLLFNTQCSYLILRQSEFPRFGEDKKTIYKCSI